MFHITKRAMVKKDYKELDEAIKAKIVPYLYNNGEGKMVPIAQLACLRNRDRPTRKQVSRKRRIIILSSNDSQTAKELTLVELLFQFPAIKELGEAAFNFVFEGSELLDKLTEGLDPQTCELQ